MSLCHTPAHPGVYEVGETVLVTAGFTDRDGEAADPVTITAMVTSPTGAVTSYTLAGDPTYWDHPETGTYVFEVPAGASVSGTWEVKITGVVGSDTAISKTRYKVKRA